MAYNLFKFLKKYKLILVILLLSLITSIFLIKIPNHFIYVVLMVVEFQ